MKLNVIILSILSFLTFSISGQKIQFQETGASSDLLIQKNTLLTENLRYLNSTDLIFPNSNRFKSTTSKLVLDSIITDTYNILVNDWETTKREIYFFDPQWNSLYYINYVHPENSSNWVPSVKLVSSSYTYYRWDKNTGGWVDSLKVEYNDEGTTAISYLWNKAENNWDPRGKTEFLYDNWGDYKGNIYSVWDKASNSWSKYSQTTKSFDFYGEIQYTDLWNSSTNQWDDYEKIAYLDDESGHLELANYYRWSSGTNNWVIYKKDDYVNFNNYSNGTMDFSVQVTTSMWDQNNSIWVYSSRRTIYYGEHFQTAINETNKNIFRIYPNPFGQEIYVEDFSQSESVTFELIDLNGKQILQRKIYGKTTISTSDLNFGIYLFKIKSNGQIQTGKIVKEIK